MHFDTPQELKLEYYCHLATAASVLPRVWATAASVLPRVWQPRHQSSNGSGPLSLPPSSATNERRTPFSDPSRNARMRTSNCAEDRSLEAHSGVDRGLTALHSNLTGSIGLNGSTYVCGAASGMVIERIDRPVATTRGPDRAGTPRTHTSPSFTTFAAQTPSYQLHLHGAQAIRAHKQARRSPRLTDELTPSPPTHTWPRTHPTFSARGVRGNHQCDPEPRKPRRESSVSATPCPGNMRASNQHTHKHLVSYGLGVRLRSRGVPQGLLVPAEPRHRHETAPNFLCDERTRARCDTCGHTNRRQCEPSERPHATIPANDHTRRAQRTTTRDDPQSPRARRPRPRTAPR